MSLFFRVMQMVLIEIDLDAGRLLEWMYDVRNITHNVQTGCLPSLLGYTMRFGG